MWLWQPGSLLFQGYAADFEQIVNSILGFELEDTEILAEFKGDEHFGYGEREIEIAEPEQDIEDFDDSDEI